MRFSTELFKDEKERLMRWHRWFAWHPVRWDGGWAWLEPVWRSASEASWDGYGGMIWRYRPMGDEPQSPRTSEDK